MSSVFDVDVLLLLATALAAKRRPAEPVEILAALDLIQSTVPAEEKLSQSFARLGAMGLLSETSGRVGLTPVAETLIGQLSRKGEHAQRLFELKGLLAAHKPAVEGAPVVIGSEALAQAVLAHRAAAAAGGKNLLVPKPRPEAKQARPGQRQRKPLPKSRKR